MKTLRLLLLTCLILQYASWIDAQNSDCQNPSGAMQQPNDPAPTCFTGYSGINSGALTQYYTFVATTAEMTVELTPVLGTACGFPNTAINYSNFELYNTGDCTTLQGNSPMFNNLTIGAQYTFGVTMTPQDPSCVWIAQACPRVVEVTNPLPADLLYFTGKVDGPEVQLSWDTPNGPLRQEFNIMRRGSPLEPFQLVGTIDSQYDKQDGYTWMDPQPIAGRIQYYLEIMDQNGNRSQSDWMELEVEPSHTLQLFPNPCRNYLKINFPEGNDQGYALFLCTLDGSILHQLEGTAGELNAELISIIDDLAPGMYVVQSHDGSMKKIARFVKI